MVPLSGAPLRGFIFYLTPVLGDAQITFDGAGSGVLYTERADASSGGGGGEGTTQKLKTTTKKSETQSSQPLSSQASTSRPKQQQPTPACQSPGTLLRHIQFHSRQGLVGAMQVPLKCTAYKKEKTETETETETETKIVVIQSQWSSTVVDCPHKLCHKGVLKKQVRACQHGIFRVAVARMNQHGGFCVLMAGACMAGVILSTRRLGFGSCAVRKCVM